MKNEDRSIDILISISGTLASIGLALVAILAAKKSIDHLQSITDDLFLFSSLGFLIVLVLGYLAHKHAHRAQIGILTTVAEGVFSASLLSIVSGAVLLVYTTL